MRSPQRGRGDPSPQLKVVEKEKNGVGCPGELGSPSPSLVPCSPRGEESRLGWQQGLIPESGTSRSGTAHKQDEHPLDCPPEQGSNYSPSSPGPALQHPEITVFEVQAFRNHLEAAPKCTLQEQGGIRESQEGTGEGGSRGRCRRGSWGAAVRVLSIWHHPGLILLHKSWRGSRRVSAEGCLQKKVSNRWEGIQPNMSLVWWGLWLIGKIHQMPSGYWLGVKRMDTEEHQMLKVSLHGDSLGKWLQQWHWCFHKTKLHIEP